MAWRRIIRELSTQSGGAMKIYLAFLILVLMAFVNCKVFANPFRTHYICVPPIEPNQTNFEFTIQDQGTCQKDDTYMGVYPQSDGSILLLPATVTLSPEEKKDLDNYKRYYGGE